MTFQELPTSSTITEVPNADGTTTRTIVNQYKDGTRRTVKEILSESDTAAPQMVQALPVNPSPSAPPLLYATDVEGQQQQPPYSATPSPHPPTAPIMVADAQQPSSPPRSKKAPPVPSNILTTISILFVVLGTTFGIAAGVYTYMSQTEDNDDYEEDGMKGQWAGAGAIFLFTLATPFMFFSGKLYRMKRASKGRPAFVMASWIIYGFALAYAGGLLFLGIEVEDYVRPTWVFAAIAVNLLAFLLMMFHAEAARTR
eukprot:CAMPEP_0113650196 /NCGR_PEP_ID=MMETSP0017_2-20120614/26703_1 /TAXON_ID=2856 /ORGANISM="Cylindrotheca closterium" /LENGTH=255 /DNA_ID=CAMNT_0000562679 /DNA_START=46 /DNA_END=813 /DNA_ORIENTATION=+ /assembly_acc=CAM_ASM_000147